MELNIYQCHSTAQKMKFSIKDFFSKGSLMEKFIFLCSAGP